MPSIKEIITARKMQYKQYNDIYISWWESYKEPLVVATFTAFHQFNIYLFMITKNIFQHWAPSALVFWQWVSFQKYVTLFCNFVLSSTSPCSIKFKKVVLFARFFINIKNSDDISYQEILRGILNQSSILFFL